MSYQKQNVALMATEVRGNNMHEWGDKDVDWDGINDAAEFIADRLTDHFEHWVQQYKEKYGTVRVYCYSPHDKEAEKVYRQAYTDAVAKWPHLKEEILTDAYWPEYLTDLLKLDIGDNE